MSGDGSLRAKVTEMDHDLRKLERAAAELSGAIAALIEHLEEEDATGSADATADGMRDNG